ncbi:hypothetical protein K435DRAFT_169003 [Dendrothele bispora CBS 962.96]|uniref:Uncharacterized protein n=1 Tax=Dendrothele bispora (strain CBS 962.96) TaxID=1314807 RepID=A0A4S8MXE3_DENBC|nr:hypothetical protein K435DRAFT_169003 [Dendrothele bispora CBS 962.96]
MPKKQGLQGMGMPIPMSFPVPDKPLPDLGWGEDTQISASRKTESKRDSGSKKHLQSPAKHSRSKGREQEHDRDRVTSLNSTPSGALVKLLVAEESTTRKTRKLLDSALDRLQSASQRAAQAETQKRKTEDDALIQHAQLTKDVDEARRAASKAQNEVEMYKLRLHQLEMETAEARETIRAAQEMREDAERSAAKARATARKFKQEVAKTAAKARGRQEGYFEGLQRGRLITGMGYDYIPGDGSAYIEEVGTDAEEEFNNQRRRLQDRERDVSAIRTPYGIESGRTASSSRHHPRREPHRDPRRGDDRYTAREYDNRRQRDHHPRRERSRERHYEDNQGRHQEKYRHGYHAPESHPSSVDARTNYSGYNPRPVQDPPQDIPDGVPVSMPEPMPHIPTPPQTVVSSNDNPPNNNPLSPPQLPAHTPHQEPPPPQPQVPTVIINLNTPAATNGGLPSPPKVTVSTVPAGAGPKSVPFAPLSVPATSPPSQPPVLPLSPPQRHPRASTVPLAPGLYNDPFGSGVYPDLPLPDGESPVPRFTLPRRTTLYSEAAANAALSAGGVPFSPGLYRDSDGGLARPQPTSQPITQPGPVPPGIPRSSPDSETPSTMTGISSINHLKSFPMRVPTAEGSISGSDRGGGSRVGSRPIGTYGFARELSTIHEHSREGTPSGGGMANSEPRSVAVDQWRRSLTGVSPTFLTVCEYKINVYIRVQIIYDLRPDQVLAKGAILRATYVESSRQRLQAAVASRYMFRVQYVSRHVLATLS